MSSIEIKGSLFQPLSAKATSCTLALGPNAMSFKADTKGTPGHMDLESFQDRKHFHFTSGHYFVADIALTPEQVQQFLYLYDFKSSESGASSTPKGLKKTTAKTSRFLNSLENLTWRKILILVVVFFVCIIGFRFAWPHMTKPIVAMIPISIDKTIGKNTYSSLQGRLFNKSKLPQEQIDRLTKQAVQMQEKANLSFRPAVHFHASPLGANALALPGGPVIVTDGLVKLLKEDALILAVIGHEYGHVEERHSMRQIVHLAGITAVAGLVFGADESVLEELAGVALASWTFKNSRQHEHEADIFSLRIFAANNMDPKLVITAMEKLTDYICGKKTKKNKAADKADKFEDCKKAGSGWFSTHPSGAERIKALEDAIGK